MKIERWVQKPSLFRPYEPKRNLFWYVATTNEGYDGIGTTPEKAVLDARHEYRIWHGGPVEQGECAQGRHHKE